MVGSGLCRIPARLLRSARDMTLLHAYYAAARGRPRWRASGGGYQTLHTGVDRQPTELGGRPGTDYPTLQPDRRGQLPDVPKTRACCAAWWAGATTCSGGTPDPAGDWAAMAAAVLDKTTNAAPTSLDVHYTSQDPPAYSVGQLNGFNWTRPVG